MSDIGLGQGTSFPCDCGKASHFAHIPCANLLVESIPEAKAGWVSLMIDGQSVLLSTSKAVELARVLSEMALETLD